MKIACVYGGCSIEHEISILTALQLLKYFDEDEVILIYVSKENRFFIGECLKDFEFYETLQMNHCHEIIFEKKYQDVYVKEKRPFGKKTRIDLVFPFMHGASGEDGSIQGYFELLNVPYAQSKCSTCAIFMDKDIMRKMFKACDIPCNPALVLHKQDILNDLDQLNKIELAKPWIVKPAKGGSSIGINCIYDSVKMNRLICESFAFDRKLVLEHKLENVREFNIAVLGNEHEQMTSLIEEIHINHDYYSYSDKYGGSIVKQNNATRSVPAQIDQILENEMKELALRAFKIFECSGVVRFDFLYTDHLMMNEINIIPGSLSIYLFKGICTPSKMIQLLKKYAFEEFQMKSREIHEIDSFIFKNQTHIDYLNK